MKQLKIAYVLGGLPFGGVERWLYDLNMEFLHRNLNKEFNQEQNPVEIKAKVFNISGTGNLHEEYVKAGIDVEKVSHSKRALNFYRIDTLFRLRKTLRDFAPDIIHTMHFYGNFFARLAALGLGAPVITHLRNTKHEKKILRRISDKLLSYATTEYFAVSKAVAKVVQSDHNLAKRPVRTLYNVIDPRNFDVEPLDITKEFGLVAPVVICVGRYVAQKNMDKVIRAVGILLEQKISVSLLLVGEGAERSRLENLIHSLGLEKNVVLTGFRNDVPALYKASDIFVMPSEFEGFLIAQLEAMYCALPCVVSANVPAKEIAEDSALICSTEAVDIAEKIKLVLCDENLRSHMAARARQIAEQYTIDKYVDELLVIYKSYLHPYA